MSQNSLVAANGSGAAVRSAINNALNTLVTQNSGASAPSTTYGYMLWADTTAVLLKIRNGANSAWVDVGKLDQANLSLASLYADNAFTARQKWAKGADLTAAATVTPGTDGNYFAVTGNTGMTAIASLQAGTIVVFRFTGTPLITHNGTSLILQDAINLQIAAGDIVAFISEGSGNWRELWRRLATPLKRGLSQYVRRLVALSDQEFPLSKIRLIHADAITMNDGEEVLDWNDLLCDMGTAGANGLDTGSEAASTWYKLLAIRKKSDGTKGLLFHRAKDYFLDIDASTSNGAQDKLRQGATDRVKLAQGFQTATTGKVEFVDVKIYKTGSPTGLIWFTIEADSSGNPSGTPLATSDKYDVSRFATAAYLTRHAFRIPVSLTTSTQYHLVLQGNYTASAVNYLNWDGNSVSQHAGGTAKKFDGTTWAAAAPADFSFKAYVTRNETNDDASLPSGYDQYAHIGWMFNDGSSNLKAVEMFNRVVMHVGDTSWKIGSSSTTTPPVLFDVAAFYPPIAVMQILGVSGSVSTGTIQVGHISAVDLDGNQTPRRNSHLVNIDSNTYTSGEHKTQRLNFIMEYQGMLYSITAGTGHMWSRGFEW